MKNNCHSSIYLIVTYGVLTVIIHWTIRTKAFNLGNLGLKGSSSSSLQLTQKIVQHNHTNLLTLSTTTTTMTIPWEPDKPLPPPYVVINFGNWTTLFDNTPGEIELEKRSMTVVFCIIMACKAPYPIKLVHEANEWGDVTGPVDVSFRNRVLYDDRFFNLTYNFRDPSSYIFYLRNKFKFAAVVDDLTFSCQAIHNPCLRRTTLFTFLGKDPNHMKITLNEGTDICPSTPSPPPPLSGPPNPLHSTPFDTHPDNDESHCDAIFYYWATTFDDATPHYSFRCLFTSDGGPGEVKRFECATKPKCRNILDKGREQKHCWRRYEGVKSPCVNCQPDITYTFKAFVAVCTRGSHRVSAQFEQSSIGTLGFYGVVQGDEKRPKLFFSDDDVDPQQMISLTGFSEYQRVGATITAHCRLAAYYASATFQFALEIEGEDELILLTPPFNDQGDSIENRTGWINWMGAWEHDMIIRLGDPKIKRVYCFGGIQDTYDWLNASVPIAFSLDDQSPEDEGRNLNTVLLVVAILIVVSVGGIGGTIFVRQWIHKKIHFREVTDDEIELFYEGDKNYPQSSSSSSLSPNPLNPDDPPPVYCLAYNRRFEVPRKRIVLNKSNILGSGEFGEVIEGWVLPPPPEGGGYNNGERIKIKVGVKQAKGTVDVQKFLAFLHEIKIMAYLDKHPNIVLLVAACTESMKRRKAMAALEFCENGDLLTYLQKRGTLFQDLFRPATTAPYVTTFCNVSHQELLEGTSSTSNSSDLEIDPISTLDLLKFSVGIANGMKYLSEKRVVHGDLSLKNILLTASMEAKISDFGLSSLLLQNSNYVTTPQIPWKWTALEALPTGRMSIHADVWSFGIVLWEIFSLGQEPYAYQVYCGFVDKLRTGYRMDPPPYSNDEISGIMKDCWKENRHDRPSFSNIHGQLLALKTRLDCGQ